MTKLDQLKIDLIVWKRTKSVTKATDICNWLYDELLSKDADATPNEPTIEGKQ